MPMISYLSAYFGAIFSSIALLAAEQMSTFQTHETPGPSCQPDYSGLCTVCIHSTWDTNEDPILRSTWEWTWSTVSIPNAAVCRLFVSTAITAVTREVSKKCSVPPFQGQKGTICTTPCDFDLVFACVADTNTLVFPKGFLCLLNHSLKIFISAFDGDILVSNATDSSNYRVTDMYAILQRWSIETFEKKLQWCFQLLQARKPSDRHFRHFKTRMEPEILNGYEINFQEV